MRARARAARRAGQLGVLSLALASAAGKGEAQELRLTLAGGRLMDERGEARDGASAGGSLHWRGKRGELGASLQAAMLGGERVNGSGGSWGTLVVAGAGAVELVAEGRGWVGIASGYRVGSAEAGPRVRVRGRGLAVEAGPHLAVGAQRRAAVEPGGVVGLPREGSAQVVRRERGLSAGASARRGVLGVEAGWCTARGEGSRWTEWSGGATVELGRASLGGSAGVRSGGLEERWAGAHLGVSVGPNAAVVVDVGRNPSSPVSGRTGGKYASAGLVLRLGGGR